MKRKIRLVRPRGHPQGRPHHQTSRTGPLQPRSPRLPHREWTPGRWPIRTRSRRPDPPSCPPEDRDDAPLEPYTVIDLNPRPLGPHCVPSSGHGRARGTDLGARGREGDFPRAASTRRTSTATSARSPSTSSRRAASRSSTSSSKPAHVVVDKLPPDVKTRLGIDYETSPIKPRLVYRQHLRLRQDGPYRDRRLRPDRPGMGGLMSITGLPRPGPGARGHPVADLTAGIFWPRVSWSRCSSSDAPQGPVGSHLAAPGAWSPCSTSRRSAGSSATNPPQAATTIRPHPHRGVQDADGHLNIAASGQHMFRASARPSARPLLEDPRFAPPRTAPEPQGLAVELERDSPSRTHPVVGRGAPPRACRRPDPRRQAGLEDEQIPSI